MATIKSIEEKAKAYDGNYKVYTELINRLENVKEAIKKQNYGIAMDILFKPYPEYQITTSPELKEREDESIIRDIRVVLESSATRIFKENGQMPVWYDRAVAWLEKQGEQKSDDIRTTGYWNVQEVEQKSAWSKEDEQYITDTLNLLSFGCSIHSISEVQDFLLSLKNRYTWKPSDEQMERLKGAIDSLPHQEVLYSLYQDLKKLKG